MTSENPEEPAGSGTRTRFTGALSDVSIFDLFQTLELSRKHGVVEFETDVGAGEVWFQEGRIIDAATGDATGEAAIYRLAMAQRGTFAARFKDIDRETRIGTPLQGLLMEAARRSDEWMKAAGEELKPATYLSAQALTLDVSPEGLADRTMQMLARIDGNRPLVAVIEPGDPDAPMLFKELAELLERDVIHEVGPPDKPAPAPELPDDLLAREYAWFVTFGQEPLRVAMRSLAVVLLGATLVTGLALLDWRVLLGGQLVGWALLLIGHAISSAPEVPITRPRTFALEPVLATARGLERVGVQLGFVARGRAIERGPASSV